MAWQECSVLNPVGEKVARSTNYRPFVATRINPDCRVIHLDGNGEKLAAAKAKYGPEVTIFDPGNLGAVLLTSEREGLSVRSLIAEFGIETWDEYYRRSAANRLAPGNLAD